MGKKKAASRKRAGKKNKVSKADSPAKGISLKSQNTRAESRARAIKATTAGPSKLGELFATVKSFLQESKVELKKVTWPTRKETLATTSVVLVVVFFIAGFLGVVDWALGHVIGYFLR